MKLIREQEEFRPFMEWCGKRLGLKTIPDVRFVDHSVTDEEGGWAFGIFDEETDTIEICSKGRHPVDIMRTIAHELTHHRQRERRELLDGHTGSKTENEANLFAGILVREYTSLNPEMFKV